MLTAITSTTKQIENLQQPSNRLSPQTANVGGEVFGFASTVVWVVLISYIFFALRKEIKALINRMNSIEAACLRANFSGEVRKETAEEIERDEQREKPSQMETKILNTLFTKQVNRWPNLDGYWWFWRAPSDSEYAAFLEAKGKLLGKELIVEKPDSNRGISLAKMALVIVSSTTTTFLKINGGRKNKSILINCEAFFAANLLPINPVVARRDLNSMIGGIKDVPGDLWLEIKKVMAAWQSSSGRSFVCPCLRFSSSVQVHQRIVKMRMNVMSPSMRGTKPKML